jgi:hypothetical protein
MKSHMSSLGNGRAHLLASAFSVLEVPRAQPEYFPVSLSGDPFNHNKCFQNFIEVGDAVEDSRHTSSSVSR